MGYKVAKAVAEGVVERGITLCGIGIGMSIVANKVVGVCAAVCNDELTWQMSRRHNNANVLCLATDVVDKEMMRRIVKSWLETDFEDGGRHERRIRKIACVKRGEAPSICDTSEIIRSKNA